MCLSGWEGGRWWSGGNEAFLHIIRTEVGLGFSVSPAPKSSRKEVSSHSAAVPQPSSRGRAPPAATTASTTQTNAATE